MVQPINITNLSDSEIKELIERDLQKVINNLIDKQDEPTLLKTPTIIDSKSNSTNQEGGTTVGNRES